MIDPDDESDEEDHDEDSDDGFEQHEYGCLFPCDCCMPGLHKTDECHTVEMLMAHEEAMMKLEAINAAQAR